MENQKQPVSESMSEKLDSLLSEKSFENSEIKLKSFNAESISKSPEEPQGFTKIKDFVANERAEEYMAEDCSPMGECIADEDCTTEAGPEECDSENSCCGGNCHN